MILTVPSCRGVPPFAIEVNHRRCSAVAFLVRCVIGAREPPPLRTVSLPMPHIGRGGCRCNDGIGQSVLRRTNSPQHGRRYRQLFVTMSLFVTNGQISHRRGLRGSALTPPRSSEKEWLFVFYCATQLTVALQADRPYRDWSYRPCLASSPTFNWPAAPIF